MKEANKELLYPRSGKGKRVLRDSVKKYFRELLKLEDLPEELRRYVENYCIHVFDYHNYENFDMFHSELKQVFSYLKCASDKEKLQNFIAEHREEYYNVSMETCELIATLTNSRELLKWKEHQNKKTGGVNMYNALEEIRREGIEQGIKALIETCADFGKSKEETTSKVIQKFLLSPAEAAAYTEKYWN